MPWRIVDLSENQTAAEAPEYEYRGLIATCWDLFRGDTSNWSDRHLYRAILKEYGDGPALDVGCGTGRLLLDYLAEGIEIHGMDNSPEMLELCREKAFALGLNPLLYLGEMETLDLPQRYRVIIVPSSSFQLVTDRAKAEETMRRFYYHLLPGGILVMPFHLGWWEGQPTDPEWYPVHEVVNPKDGLTYRRHSRSRFDPKERLEHTEDVYEVLRDGEVMLSERYERSPAVRWYTQDETIALYHDAGFTNIRLWNDFTRDPATTASTLFTSIGTKP
jgi:SAM-dependent methyltransferase